MARTRDGFKSRRITKMDVRCIDQIAFPRWLRPVNRLGFSVSSPWANMLRPLLAPCWLVRLPCKMSITRIFTESH